MPREKLPNRRVTITSTVEYWDSYAISGRQPMEIDISFGFISQAGKNVLKEVFIASKSHPQTPLLNDICILLSRLLQFGDTIEKIVAGLGENRKEMETSGPPSSFIGAIARQGVTVQNDINQELAKP